MTIGIVEMLMLAGQVLLLIAFGLFLAIGLEPAVSWLIDHRFPRWAAVLAVFGGLLLPKLVEQLGGDPANVLKYRSVFPYVLMLVVIAIRPQGLFGKTERRL